MKNFYIIFIFLFIISCNPIKEYNEKQDLYDKVEYFVNTLSDYSVSYGIEGYKYTKYSKNKYYKIMPVGRLINVRIEEPVSSDKYLTLKKDLKRHFKSNVLVKDVYICNGGTVMIDCRRSL